MSKPPPQPRRLANTQTSGSARARNTAEHTSNEASAAELDPHAGGSLVTGQIIRVHTALHSFIVRVSADAPALRCVMLERIVGAVQGVKTWTLPSEGTPVLVWRPSNDQGQGVILGCLPMIRPGESPIPWMIPPLDGENLSGLGALGPWFTQQMDPKLLDKIEAVSHRPVDALPGSTGWMSELGVGVVSRIADMVFKAGDGARLELNYFDQLVRIIAQTFNQYLADRDTEVFEDGAFTSGVTTGAPYLVEMMGQLEPDGTIFEPRESMDEEYKETAYVPVEKGRRQAIPRWQVHTGHLGGLLSLFVMVPDPDDSPRMYESQAQDAGVFHVNIQPSGRLHVRSASDIIFERTHRIAVPRKLRDPEDPEGDKLENGDARPQPRRPFTFDADARARALQTEDAMGHWTGELYQGTKEAKKDWSVPEESDRNKIPEDLDQVMGDSALYEQFIRLSSRMVLGADGSILLRASGGSEIFLDADGNVSITAPKEIRLHSGKGTQVLGGTDVVVKARDSVDISATEKDVRIKAENNLHVHTGRSIAMFCDGQGDKAEFEGNEGEDVVHTGILFKAPKSRILLRAANLHLSATTKASIEVVTGTLQLIGTTLLAFARTVLIRGGADPDPDADATGTPSDILLAGSRALVSAGGVELTAKGSVSAFGGDRAYSLGDRVDVQDARYDDTRAIGDKLEENTVRIASWRGPYVDDDFYDTLLFTFRTAEQLGTADGYKVYQPYWQVMIDTRHGPDWMTTLSVQEWNEKRTNDTYPWPGYDAYENDQTLQVLEEQKNVDEGTPGSYKPRADRTESGGPLTTKSMTAFPAVPDA